MAQSQKLLKESFVSNLSGGEIGEINMVATVAPAAVFLWSALQSRQSFFFPYGPVALVADFLLNVGAILFATTLYSSAPLLLNILLLSPAILLYAITSAAKSPKPKKVLKPSQVDGEQASKTVQGELDPFPIRPFLTFYRGSMLVVTCLAILAVDFRVFPRRFAKVETWGTSLMDMGVGSFVFSAGLVSARPILKDHLSGQTTFLFQRLYASARHSLPLFILGLIRLYSVKGLDYAEHVTEYGVHWNFFFTLAFLPPFMALFQSFFKIIPSYSLLALLVGIIYQALLEFTTLKAYILVAPRTDLLSKNREGVFSLFGYLAIFLAGQSTGMDVLPRKVPTASDSNTEQRKRLIIRLAAWSSGWSALLFFSMSYRYGLGLQVSRRLANLPYILWVSAFNCTQVMAFGLIETIVFPEVYKANQRHAERKEGTKASSKIMRAYNRNGLPIFLLANLLTGCINLTVNTLTIQRALAMAILLGYAALLTGVALALDEWNISIKF